MPRQPRLEAPGLIYHLISRGIEKRDIFKERGDYYFFLERLGDILIDTKTECLAFCLMPNHFHLLLRSGQTPISTVMRRLMTSYAVVFNKRHQRVGHLFQNRYKSKICQEQTYLIELIRYIHRNPLRAGIVKTIRQLNGYPFSGHHVLMTSKRYRWYATEAVLSHFGHSAKSAKRNYLALINDGLPDAKNTSTQPEEAEPVLDARVLGDVDFVQAMHALDRSKQPAVLDASIDGLVTEIAAYYGFSREQIRGNGRDRRLNKAKALISYLATSRLGLSFADVAKELGVHRSSAARLASQGKMIRDVGCVCCVTTNHITQQTQPTSPKTAKPR